MKDGDAPDGFLSRWSRRKALVREGAQPPEPAAPDPAALPAAVAAPVAEVPAAAPPTPAVADQSPPPTLDDVAQLGRASDYRRFVAPDVSPDVRNAALRKLFSDPQFNVMDGLDTYIDDYGKPDPIPPAMLRQMLQSRFLGFLDDESDKEDDRAQTAGAIPDGAAPVAEAQSPSEPMLVIADDQDPAVRLQPLDAAGPDSDPGGAGEDARRER